ncbi:hypothetical protein [Enterobacter cancerogenus]|uniref:hypothetical protein n=1 Tax=Enterobacter cancerogenus TaxID=69218 RepID=UPI0040593DAA
MRDKLFFLILWCMPLMHIPECMAINFPDFHSGYACYNDSSNNYVFEGYVSRIAATTLRKGWNGYYIEVTSMDGTSHKSGYVYYRWYGYQQIAHLAYISKIYGNKVKICFDDTYIYAISLEN